MTKRVDPPKSARLNVSKVPNSPYFATTLNVNGKDVVMMIDTGSSDLSVLSYVSAFLLC